MLKKEKLWVTMRWRAGVTLLVLVGFVAGGFCSLYLKDRQNTQLHEHYNLLSRRALSDNPSDVLLDFRPLQTDYEQYLNDKDLNDKVSLYFEYLPTGSSIGIHEDKESLGASLLKLPLAINYYKLVEEGKLSLTKKVGLKKEWLNSDYGTLYKKGEGYQLTYREAITYTLRDSDNTAALMLFDAIATAEGTDAPNLMAFVDANYDANAQKEILIGVQSYSSIMKCLYFTCFINRDDSQAVLRDLSHSGDSTRLTLFTPNDLTVAHKIGTFGGVNQSDCGIFYVPKRNYMLCIMVQESDPAASRVIGDLSQMTYDYIVPPQASEPLE